MFKNFVIGLIFSTFLISSTVYAKKTKIGVWGINTTSGLSKGEVLLISDMIATEVDKLKKSWKIFSQRDLDSMVKLEERRQKFGSCNETSCLAEIGSALGVEFLVTGSVGKLGSLTILNLQLIEVDNVDVKNRITKRIRGDLGILAERMPYFVAELFETRARHTKIIEKSLSAKPKKKKKYKLKKERKRRYVSIDITSNKAGAKIYMNSQYVGKTPLLNKTVPTGTYRIRTEYRELLHKKKITIDRRRRLYFEFGDSVYDLKTKTEWIACKGLFGGGMQSPVALGEVSFFTVRWEKFYIEALRGGGGSPFIGYWGTSFGGPIHIGNTGTHEIRLGLHFSFLYGYNPLISGLEVMYIAHAAKYFGIEVGARVWGYPTIGTSIIGFRI